MKKSNRLTVSDAFGSLFSNDKAIACSKVSPLWLTIILFFVAVIIPIVPLAVSAANSYGSAFIGNNSYGFEKTMPKIALEMAKDDIKFLTVNEDHELSITNDDAVASYKHVNSTTGHTEMEVFFSAAKESKSKSAFINSVADHKYVLNDDGENTTYYHSSYTVFFNNSIYCCIYEPNSTNIITASSYGDYKSFKPGTNLVELLTTVEGQKLAPTSDAQILDLLADNKVNNGVFNNWKTVFNKAYETSKVRNVWLGSLLYLGIYTGMSLIMALLIWIMTRGKNNPFSYLSLLACFKIESWASVCPGLIALVLGFFLTQYAVMLFIMTLGMRVMWIAMRQLRPQA